MAELDVLSSPEVLALLAQLRRSAPALTRALRRVEELSDSGALDTVMDLAEVVHAARQSLSDGMIARMAEGLRVLIEMADRLSVSGAPDRLPALLDTAAAARAEAAADRRPVGLLSLMAALREEEVQFVLRFMLALARRLPRAMQETR